MAKVAMKCYFEIKKKTIFNFWVELYLVPVHVGCSDEMKEMKSIYNLGPELRQRNRKPNHITATNVDQG